MPGVRHLGQPPRAAAPRHRDEAEPPRRVVGQPRGGDVDRRAVRPYYEDGSVVLYHGKWEDVLPSLDLSDVALTLTDPPYNVGLNYSDGDNRDDYAEWTRAWFDLCPQPLVVTPGLRNLAMWLSMEKPRWVCAWFKPNQNS